MNGLPPRDKAGVLLEALPYFQQFRGETFLIKMGGSAMENEALVQALMRDVVFLELVGINPVIVHGGGKAISAALEEAQIEAQFIAGLRVTSEEAMQVVEKTLNSQVNPMLVEMINDHKGQAVGVPGQEVFKAKRLQKKGEGGTPVDLGAVGEVQYCDTAQVLHSVQREIVPVLSPVAEELETGRCLNINADLAAASLATAIKPAKLIYISDVPGLMRDPSRPETLIASINPEQASVLMEEGIIKGGMIPKVQSALEALRAGVGKVHFIDGREAHTLLLEIFTDSGIGTEILP